MPDQSQTETADSLRALGAQVDAEQSAPEAVSDTPPETQPVAVETTKPDATEGAKDQPPAADADKSKTSADSVAEPKKESEYAKGWKRQQETKARLEEREKALEQREREIAEKAKALPVQPQQIRDADGFTAKDHAKAAEDSARDAEDSLDENEAARLRALSERFKATAARLHQEEQQAEVAAIETKRISYLEEMAKTEPDIQADLKSGKAESPLGKAIVAVLNELPGLRQSAEGIKYAVPIAKSRLIAATLPALEAKIKELTEQNQKLVQSTSLTSSGPVRRGGNGSTPDLSADSMRQMAAQYDEEHMGFAN